MRPNEPMKLNVHKPPIQIQAVNPRCASGQSSSNECAIELAGVETAAVKKLQASR